MTIAGAFLEKPSFSFQKFRHLAKPRRLLYSELSTTMAKQPATIFVCQNCGNQARKWLGQCPDCGEWNTFVEERFRPSPQAGGGGVVAHFRSTAPIPYRTIES